MSLTMKVVILIVAVCIYSLIMPYTGLTHYPAAFIAITILFSLSILAIARIITTKYAVLQSELTAEISKSHSLTERVTQLAENNQQLKNNNDQLHREVLTQKSANKKVLANHSEKLDGFAHYDKLTSLPTRIFFNESLNKSIIHAKRRKQLLAVLIINLDSFKKVNETAGQEAGDLIIKEIAKRFANTLRAEDILAKLESDEFIILLNDIGKAKFASTVAEKLLRACALPCVIHQQELRLTASIGIAVYPNDGTSLETILSNANTALDAVKLSGGNNYQFYTKSMDIEGREYIQLESALRKAIENNELSLHYQPRLHLKRGHITGIEALLRWTHPQMGAINPATFIPLAEETNLIIPLGEWALTEACKTNKHWQDEGYEHMTVSLNLSTKQFYHPDLCTMVARVLKNTGLSPDYLELEITETMVMSDMAKSQEILDQLKACGVKISIDHFGVGYTSISHLKQFPISAIKIDQSFIKGLPNIPNDLSIVNAFIALAQNLGLQVVAEGVETVEQVEYLANQNCDLVQGYYLSHPVPADKIALQFKKLMDDVLVSL